MSDAGNQHAVARWRVPGAGWVATISYSLYLSHKLVIHAVHAALQRWPAVHGIAAFVVYAVAIAVVGALLHYAVERPFLRLRTRLLRADPEKPTAMQAA